MPEVVSWRLEDEKIILGIVDEESGTEFDLILPDTIYKEIVIEGPPSEEKEIREIINKIHEIRKKRVLEIEKMDKDIETNMGKQDDAQKELKNAGDRTEIQKWGAMIRSIQAQKASIDTRRHLCKLLYQEEGKLRAMLLRKLRSR